MRDHHPSSTRDGPPKMMEGSGSGSSSLSGGSSSGVASPAAALDCLCLGAPILDHLVRVQDAFLIEQGYERGGCIPVSDSEALERVLQSAMAAALDPTGLGGEGGSQPVDEIALDGEAGTVVTCGGGSAANVAKGLARLGLAVGFVGKVGRDGSGERYRQYMGEAGVCPLFVHSDTGTHTGQVAALVSPDGERTMRTFLGASAELTGPEFLGAVRRAMPRCRLLHVEGYVLYNPKLVQTAMKAAKDNGALVSLDLASFELVRRHRGLILNLIRTGLVDIVFANEAEAEVLAAGLAPLSEEMNKEAAKRRGKSDRAGAGGRTGTHHWQLDPKSVGAPHSVDIDVAAQVLVENCLCVVISLGSRGCLACTNAERVRVPAYESPAVVDSTGAGDFFASGFLHAYLTGQSLLTCANRGCLVGGMAVRAMGAEIRPEDWAIILDFVQAGKDRVARRFNTNGRAHAKNGLPSSSSAPNFGGIIAPQGALSLFFGAFASAGSPTSPEATHDLPSLGTVLLASSTIFALAALAVSTYNLRFASAARVA